MAKAKVKTIKVKLVKSTIGRLPAQRATIKALGLKKIRQVVEKKATPEVLGMVKSVSHLVEVEEI